jgi:hypothetical protein
MVPGTRASRSSTGGSPLVAQVRTLCLPMRNTPRRSADRPTWRLSTARTRESPWCRGTSPPARSSGSPRQQGSSLRSRSHTSPPTDRGLSAHSLPTHANSPRVATACTSGPKARTSRPGHLAQASTDSERRCLLSGPRAQEQLAGDRCERPADVVTPAGASCFHPVIIGAPRGKRLCGTHASSVGKSAIDPRTPRQP